MTETLNAEAAQPLFRDIAQAKAESDAPFRSSRPLAIAFSAVAALKLIETVVIVVGLAMRLKVLNDMRHLAPGLGASLGPAARFADKIVVMANGIGLILLLAGYVTGGMWTYRAARNVRAVGARGLTVSPGWAVGFYAVPIAAWFRPLQAMSEIWRASHWPDLWRSHRTPSCLAFWWAGWIGITVVGAIGAVTSRMPDTLAAIVAENDIAVVDQACTMVTMGLFVMIIWQTVRAQQASHLQALLVAETFA